MTASARDRIALVAGVLVVGAAGISCHGGAQDSGGGEVLVSETVGPSGARVQGPGVVLDIPGGALASSQQITITTSSARPGPTFSALGPTVQLQPAGLQFAQPVTITLQVPSGHDGLVFWSTPGDETKFEFVGFAHDGVAIATNDHFSIVGAAEEDDNHEAEHSEPEAGDAVDHCDISSAGNGGGGGGTASKKCLRPCLCMAQDAAGGALCPSDQGRGSGSLCPGNPEWLTSNDDDRMLAEGDGLACSGFRHVEVQASLCECDGRPPGSSSDEALCATPWSSSWQCDSTATGTSPDGQEYVAAVPSAGQTGLGISAFIGAEGTACKGYYKPSSPGGSSGSISGKLTSCHQGKIDTKWEPVSGKTASCTFSDDDRVRCRLTPRQWQTLQQRRADCGFPARSRTGERDAGPKDKRGQMLITTAILNVNAIYPTTEITGFSSRAQRDLDARRDAGHPSAANCPGQAPIVNDWSGLVGGTILHAEGGALLRSSEAAGFAPGTVPPDTYPPVGHPRVGELLVDRRPCNLFCRPGGIDQARRAAGLSQLTVRSPGGCLIFTAAEPRGVPCP